MKNPIILALALAACGAPPEDLFEDSPDAGPEIGTVEQGMKTKFSPLYTFGVCPTSTSRKAMQGTGCGASAALLPGKGLVRFKVTGTDPHEGTNASWKYQVRRALTDSFRTSTTGFGYGWPFGTAVEENTANTWVEATSGNCPGDGSGNDITEFACVQWSNGNSPLVTESFGGTYRRFSGTGTVKLIFDNEAIDEKCLIASCDANDWHELVEHAAHAIAPVVYGSGIYSTDQIGGWGGDYSSWSSPTALQSDYRRFTRAEYTLGETCRAGNWIGTATSLYEAASGSCAN